MSARHKFLLLLPFAIFLLCLLLTRFVARAYGGTAGGHFLQFASACLVLLSVAVVSRLAPGPANNYFSWPRETQVFLALGMIPAIFFLTVVAFALVATLFHAIFHT